MRLLKWPDFFLPLIMSSGTAGISSARHMAWNFFYYAFLAAVGLFLLYQVANQFVDDYNITFITPELMSYAELLSFVSGAIAAFGAGTVVFSLLTAFLLKKNLL